VEISSTKRYAMLWRTAPDKVLCWRYATLRAETADGGSDAGAGAGVARFKRQQYLRLQTRG
jgi:hypothetical protein